MRQKKPRLLTQNWERLGRNPLTATFLPRGRPRCHHRAQVQPPLGTNYSSGTFPGKQAFPPWETAAAPNNFLGGSAQLQPNAGYRGAAAAPATPIFKPLLPSSTSRAGGSTHPPGGSGREPHWNNRGSGGRNAPQPHAEEGVCKYINIYIYECHMSVEMWVYIYIKKCHLGVYVDARK